MERDLFKIIKCTKITSTKLWKVKNDMHRRNSNIFLFYSIFYSMQAILHLTAAS